MGPMSLRPIGYPVLIVGKTNPPEIMKGDLLLLASVSGTTASVYSAAEKAKNQKATIIAITADADSKLAKIADHIVLLKAATKTDFGVSVSEQYAASLFEQATLLILESVFMTLWQESGLTKEDLWPKHANLE